MTERPLLFVAEQGGALALELEHLAARLLPLPAVSRSTPVERLALRNIEALQRVQPSGPYRLLGNSLGGLVAYEMATQLIGRDEVVEFLGMIDCSRPRNGPGAHRHPDVMMATIESYCPRRLPIPVHLFVPGEPSARAQVSAWQALLGASLQVIDVASPGHSGGVAAAVESTLARLQPRPCTADPDYSPIITLQVGAPRVPPMFFVPGAGASVTSFMPLADALGAEATVHGLQARGLGGVLIPHSTVEAAAAVYLREIRKVRRHGPYCLAGHSFGGWVVLEMAHCLLAAGEAVVDPIVLIDSDSPTTARGERRHLGRVDALVKLIAVLEEATGKEMHLSRGELEPLDYDSQLVRLAHGMRALGVLPGNGGLQSVRDLVRVFALNLNTRYVPRARLSGSALLIQAAEPSVRTDCDDDIDAAAIRAAWRDHVAHLECRELPGKHMTLLKRPNVDAIAELLWQRWRNPRGGAQLRQPVSGGVPAETGSV